jgi:selenocysteine lyase/cysteine desulfurase
VPKAEYNALRFSTHVYNREEDVERTAEALSAMLA